MRLSSKHIASEYKYQICKHIEKKKKNNLKEVSYTNVMRTCNYLKEVEGSKSHIFIHGLKYDMVLVTTLLTYDIVSLQIRAINSLLDKRKKGWDSLLLSATFCCCWYNKSKTIITKNIIK